MQGSGVRAFFAPGLNPVDAILAMIDSAERTIVVAQFTFTLRVLADAIGQAIRRGVKVRVLLDQMQSQVRGSMIVYLKALEAEVRVDKEPGLMHLKYCIVDNARMVTGSFNWTKQATRLNRENLLVIEIPEIVKLHVQNFEEIWQSAE